MAHAAVVASVSEPGQLICPFVVVSKGQNRQAIDFVAETQDQAVDRAWASLDEYREHVDLWAMAREGLIAGASGKDDVLVVCVWTRGMPDAAVFTQRFRPSAQGFGLVGPVELQESIGEDELELIKGWFAQGIESHPKGAKWKEWREKAEAGK